MSKSLGKIGRKYKKKEHFSGKKFGRGFNLFSFIWWGKAISDTFKVIIILAIILGLIFGAGIWFGKKEQPVPVRYRDFRATVRLADGQKHTVEVKNHLLFVDKKLIRVKNVPELKPLGIDLRLKLFAGVGSRGAEMGIGVSVVRYNKFHLDLFGTQKALYVGLSRELQFGNFIKNSSIGIGIGKSFDELLNKTRQRDLRMILYWNIPF